MSIQNKNNRTISNDDVEKVGISRGKTAADRFTIIPNGVLRNVALSYRARGILGRLLSNAPGFSMTAADLANESSGEGRDAVLNALKELREHGYLVTTRHQNEQGRWATLQEVFDSPQDVSGLDEQSVRYVSALPPKTDFQDSVKKPSKTETGFPGLGEPGLGKPELGLPDFGGSGRISSTNEVGLKETLSPASKKTSERESLDDFLTREQVSREDFSSFAELYLTRKKVPVPMAKLVELSAQAKLAKKPLSAILAHCLANGWVTYTAARDITLNQATTADSTPSPQQTDQQIQEARQAHAQHTAAVAASSSTWQARIDQMTPADLAASVRAYSQEVNRQIATGADGWPLGKQDKTLFKGWLRAEFSQKSAHF